MVARCVSCCHDNEIYPIVMATELSTFSIFSSMFDKLPLLYLI